MSAVCPPDCAQKRSDEKCDVSGIVGLPKVGPTYVVLALDECL